MIKLSEYIVDTQGRLPPEMIMNNRKVLIAKTNTVSTLSQLEASDFEDIDGNFIHYKFRSRIQVPVWCPIKKSHNLYRLEDLFILENKAERRIYE